MISAKFIWSGMGKDILCCKSCQVCQKCSKNGPRKAPLVIQPLYSIPFERCAFDIVRPLPKAKGGYEYILTYICLATRWPEAIPLRDASARQVTSSMVQIWTRLTFLSEFLLIVVHNSSVTCLRECARFLT